MQCFENLVALAQKAGFQLIEPVEMSTSIMQFILGIYLNRNGFLFFGRPKSNHFPKNN